MITKENPLKFFPFFAGIDAPGSALMNLNIPHELVGSSEWNFNKVLAFDAWKNGVEYDKPSETKEKMLEYLSKFTWSDNGKDVYDQSKINKWSINKIERLFVANHRIKNYGSITEIDPNYLPYADFYSHGSPCQDYSIAGKRAGGEEGSGTRSSLMWTTVDIIRVKKPKYVLWENVPGVLTAEMKPTFNKYIEKMKELGYTSYFNVLNAKEYGIPQNRERVYVISILKEENKWENTLMGFPWPKPFDNGLRLKDFLEVEVDEKYYIENEKSSKLIAMINPKKDITCCDMSINNPKELEIGNCIKARYDSGIENHQSVGIGVIEKQICVPVLTPDRLEKRQNGRRFKEDGEEMFTITTQDRHGVMVKEATKKGYDVAYPGDSINIEQPNSKTRRGRVGVAQTLTTSCNQAVVIDDMYKNREPRVFDLCPTIRSDRQGLKTIEPNECNCIGSIDINGNDSIKRVYSENGASPTIPTCGGGNQEQKVFTGYRIRKLTPKECLRLMGFYDWQIDRMIQIISNSAAYHCAGDSIVVNVLEEIFKILFLGEEPEEEQITIDSLLGGN